MTGAGAGTSEEPCPEARPERPLRVGLLVDSFLQPAWVLRILEELRASDFAEVVLVVRNAVEPPRRTPWQRLRRGARYLTSLGYLWLDARLWAQEPNALAPGQAPGWLRDLPCVAVVPRQKRFSDWFPDEAVESILAHDLDVAVRLGFRILRGRALGIARHGVWSYHHGDNLVNRGGPAGFWEVLGGQPVTGAVLQVLNEDLDNGKVIARTWTSTHRWSVQRSRNGLYWRAAGLLPRKLRDLQRLGPGALDEDPYADRWVPYAQPLYTLPSNGVMLGLLVRLMGRFLVQRLRDALFLDQWFVAYRREPHAEGPAASFFRFEPLVPPRDRFWADPFVVQHEDRHYVFVEELVYRERRGRIAVFVVDTRGRPGPPVTVLERDHHLSWPFVFQWEGRFFMVPESSAGERIELYEAVEFPHRWEPRRTLLEGVRAADPVLVEHGGRWWLFACIDSAGSRNEDLHLFHAQTPLGPWTPHARNPVKSDVRSARPAGRLFRRSGKLLRPAQDCSVRYGWAIRIHEVRRLDPEAYEEVEVGCVLPRWERDLVAVHTLNHDGGLTVIDAQRRRRRLF